MDNSDGKQSASASLVPLEALGLSIRAYSALRRAGIDSINKLQSCTDEDLLNIRNLGSKTLKEIRKSQKEFIPLVSPHNIHNLSKLKQTNIGLYKNSEIMDCGISKRTAHALARAGILAINDLLLLTNEEVMSIRNIGIGAIKEIREFLEKIDKNKIEWTDPNTDRFPIFLLNENRTILGNINISKLPLSSHTQQLLAREEIQTVTDLYLRSERDLRSNPRLRESDLEEILDVRKDLKPATGNDLRQKLLSLLIDNGIHKWPTDFSWHRFLNIGMPWKEIEELELYIIERGLSPLEKLPEDPVISHETLEYLVRIGCPLHKIVAGRAFSLLKGRAVSNSAGLQSLLNVCLLGESQFRELLQDASSQCQEDLDWYLQHLPSLEWDNEVSGLLPRPVVLWRLQQISLNQTWKSALCEIGLDQRYQDVLISRSLSTKLDVPTLDDLGKRHGVTRERIRQIEGRAKKKARKVLYANELIMTVDLLAKRIINNQGIIKSRELAETMIDMYELQEGGCEETLSQILLLDDDIKYNKTINVFASTNIPKGLLGKIHSFLNKQLQEAKAPILETDLQKEFDEYLNAEEAEFNREFHLWKKILEESQAFELVEEIYWGLTKWENRVLDEIVMALREAQEPTHFREIMKLANKRLGADRQTTERAVHAQLGNHQELFMRTGPGTFGLREWDPDKPIQPIKYRTLINQVLEEAGKPLHLDVIYEKVNELRPVKESTVMMYLSLNEDFVDLEEQGYGLSVWEVDEKKRPVEQLPTDFKKQLQERAKQAFSNQ